MFKNIILISGYILIFFSHINYSYDQYYKNKEKKIEMISPDNQNQLIDYDQDRQERQETNFYRACIGVWITLVMGLSTYDVVSSNIQASKKP